MRSVADIPGDADDDLPEISPELVLVDPDLARRVREDAAAAAAAARRRDRALRLVRGATRVDGRVEDAEPAEQAIVPRPAVTEGSPDADDRERASRVEDDELIVPRAVGSTESSATEVSDPVGEPKVEASSASQAVAPTPAVVEDVVPESAVVPGAVPTVSEPAGERGEAEEPSSPEAIVVSTTVPAVAEPASEIASDAFPVVARRVVDAEPARVVAPRPGPAFPVTVPEPAEMAPEPRPRTTLTPAMPHPIARPGGPGPTRAPHAPRGPRRGRGAIAFLASVAVASLAVLGILNLTGGTSSSGALPASGESGPSSSGAATGKAQGNDSAKAKAAAKARAQAAAKAKAQAAAKARARAEAAAKAKAAADAAARARAAKAKTAKAAKAKAAKAAKTPAAPATNGAAQPATTQGAAPAVAEPRRFAWAPVAGATAYHVELFRGSDRVLAEETKEPFLELAPTWRFEGRLVHLTPGEYRWYVWPVTKTGRATQAVVQAKLSVP